MAESVLYYNMIRTKNDWTITIWGRYSKRLTKVHYNDLTEVAAMAACEADYPNKSWSILECIVTGEKSDINRSCY